MFYGHFYGSGQPYTVKIEVGDFQKKAINQDNSENEKQFAELNERIAQLEKRLQAKQESPIVEQKLSQDSFLDIQDSIIADQEGTK